MKGIKVELNGEDDKGNVKVVSSYFLRKMNIGASIRRYALYEQIAERENISEVARNIMMICANLMVVLCDGDGNLLYPTPETGPDNCLDKLIDEMDDDVLGLLTQENMDLNPPVSSLKAKKKKF